MLTQDWTNLLLEFIQTAAIIIGGLYALYEYRRFRRYSPKIQFEVDFNLYPINDKSGNYLLNIELIVKNLGLVRKYFPKIMVGVKTLRAEDVETAQNAHKRLRFGRELVQWHNIVYKPEDPWWVDSGVTQVFPYPVVINELGDFIQVNAKIYYYKYKKEEEYHQASLVKPITTEVISLREFQQLKRLLHRNFD